MITYYTGLFIVGCWVIFWVVWLIASFAAKRTVERGNWLWRFLPVVVVLIFILSRQVGLLTSLTSAVLWEQTAATDILGAVVTLFGLSCALWARATIGSNWSSDVVIKENHELIERGPYHWVRHPIYSSMLVMYIGAAIWFGRALEFAAIILVVLALGYKALQEEQLLTKHFPDEYPSYKARVKALIPFVF